VDRLYNLEQVKILELTKWKIIQTDAIGTCPTSSASTQSILSTKLLDFDEIVISSFFVSAVYNSIAWSRTSGWDSE
jgi:hypothetical protein